MKGILQVGFGLEIRLDVLLHSSFTCSSNATSIQFPKASHLVGLACSIHYYTIANANWGSETKQVVISCKSSLPESSTGLCNQILD
ncbi:hypothetical protein OPV22_032172 [Ensete ventricosum]|uniref:Uncharacterized protein n=1 Tax=Ensete ventricosum TaxID=4639 RepID=A0AAV8P1Z0_ENSVE|nr:hypothetical protein OPV22_032172 [Ensete ventricosum]